MSIESKSGGEHEKLSLAIAAQALAWASGAQFNQIREDQQEVLRQAVASKKIDVPKLIDIFLSKGDIGRAAEWAKDLGISQDEFEGVLNKKSKSAWGS